MAPTPIATWPRSSRLSSRPPSPTWGCDTDAPAPIRRCAVEWLARVPYAEALGIQEARTAALARGGDTESFLLLEHPHVITLGRNANPVHVLAGEAARQTRGVALYRTGRGGDVTYHGPGQLVGYPILDLRPDRCDVHRYVRDLEEVLIRTAADFGVTAARSEGLTGIWVGREKLGAIGVRIARWITSHGFALNVTTDLSYFDLIVPCGIAGKGVTSLERLTGRAIPLPEVARRAAVHLGEVYGREMTFAESLRYAGLQARSEEARYAGPLPRTERGEARRIV